MNTKVDEFFTYPAKTFLIGEYAVLKKASCILVNTKPCFQFHVRFDSYPKHPFHLKSPAGQFIEKNKSIFSDVSITVQNPYSQRSGFGLSSAEFNCVYDIYLKKKNLKKNLFNLYQEYRELNLGSGADVLSQQVKGLCLLRWDPFETFSLKWPFRSLGFFLIRLQNNYPTHEHLEQLEENDFSKLVQISNRSFHAFKNSNAEQFIGCIQEYAQELERLNLVCELTKKWIQKLKKESSLLAIKGCGAFGAEVMVVFFKKERKSSVLKLLKSFQIEAGIDSIEEEN